MIAPCKKFPLKVQYLDQENAILAAHKLNIQPKQEYRVNAYKCSCGGYHIGKTKSRNGPIKPKDRERYFKTLLKHVKAVAKIKLPKDPRYDAPKEKTPPPIPPPENLQQPTAAPPRQPKHKKEKPPKLPKQPKWSKMEDKPITPFETASKHQLLYNISQNIKARCQTLYDTIKDAENELKEIRATCPHTSTIQGLYQFRPGGIYDAIICADCNHPVKLLAEHIHPVNPTIINEKSST